MTLAQQIALRIVEDEGREGRGNAGGFDLAADLLEIIAVEAALWTKRLDDAKRFSDVLCDAANELRAKARNIR